MIDAVNANRKQFNHVVAFEVSKAKLHVHILPGGETFEIANEQVDIRRVIRKELRRNRKLAIGPVLVVCEATGTYSKGIIEAAADLGAACHQAHGSRVRHYAKFRGTHAKSDPIDVRLIADYAIASRALQLHVPPRPQQAELRELVARRAELKAMMEAEQARVGHVANPLVAKGIKQHIDFLKTSIVELEARLETLVQEDDEFRHKVRLMRTVKGVGLITAATVLAYLPEIGTVSRGTIAALAGLAPFDCDSGESRGRRRIGGGRADARTGLYMAAVVAMSWNEHLSALGKRIEARGQPFKIQVTAVMRKLLVILNAVVASGAPCRMAAAGRGAALTIAA